MEAAGSKSRDASQIRARLPKTGPALPDIAMKPFAAQKTTATTTAQRANPGKPHSKRRRRIAIEQIFGTGNQQPDPANRMGKPLRVSCRKVEQVSRNQVPGRKTISLRIIL